MISRPIFVTILISLVVIRVIMVIALINGIPETKYHNGWFLHHGGDEEVYFRQAIGLAEFKKVDNATFTLGFPLLLVPFIWIYRAETLKEILIPVVIFHSWILFGLSIILIAFIAERLTKDRKIALFSAVLWTFFPYFILILLSLGGQTEVGNISMVHQMWTQVLSDPPSTFLILLSIYLYLVSLENKKLRYLLFLGIIFGYASLIRLPNMVLLTLFIPIWLYRRQFKEVFIFLGTYIFMVIPQLVYNWYINGSIFKFTHFYREIIVEKGLFSILSIDYIPYFILRLINKVSLILLFFLSLFFGFMLLALIYLYYRYQRLSATILAIWIFSFSLYYGCYYNFINGIFRYLMPAVPAGIIVVSILFLRGWKIFRKHKNFIVNHWS